MAPQCHPEGPREGPGGALEGQRASKKGPVDAPRLPRELILGAFWVQSGSPKWLKSGKTPNRKSAHFCDLFGVVLTACHPQKQGFSWEGMLGLAFHLFQISIDF